MPVHPIRFGGVRVPSPGPDADDLQRCLRALDGLDRDYGPTGPLPVEGAGDLLAATLTTLARIAQHAPESARLSIAELTCAVALWALRHELEIAPVEPVVNALAIRANASPSGEAAAPVVELMERVIENAAPRLSADLERSNPERAWRLLHVNLAITAIRSGDAAAMDRAFDALDRALPDEAAGFYAEALALALNPAIPAEVRERIAARHARPGA
jgi:hypothetical protein